MTKLSELPNIGPEIERQLTAVGIDTPRALREAGSRQAWLRIFAVDTSACYNRLLALEGAVRGIRKKELPQDVRAELKQFYTVQKG